MVKKIIQSLKNILFLDPKKIFLEEKEFINQPFYFKGTNGKGVLLVHGWTSTSYEVRRLGRYLNENGFTVMGPMLRGHGSKPEDLDDVKWQEWLRDLACSFEKLKKECTEVYVGGTSVGSTLSVLLATQKPEIKGLVLMATPYKIKAERALMFIGKIFRLIHKKHIKKYYPPTFGSMTTITRLISYQTYSIKSAMETQRLIEFTRGKFSEIKQPCFLLQSRQDHVVSHRSLDRIYERIGSKVKKKKYISRAYHTFISDIKNEHIFEDILNFLKEN